MQNAQYGILKTCPMMCVAACFQATGGDDEQHPAHGGNQERLCWSQYISGGVVSGGVEGCT